MRRRDCRDEGRGWETSGEGGRTGGMRAGGNIRKRRGEID